MPAFECKKCGTCCYGKGGIFVRGDEIERIADFLGIDPASFISRFCNEKYGRLSIKTGEDGSFVLEPLFSGDGYHLIVDHELYMKEILFNLSVKEQENTELPPIQLKKGKTIFGKVKTEKGKPILPDEEYTVATIDFLTKGGCNFEEFKEGEQINREKDVRKILADEIEGGVRIQSIIDGRIADVSGDDGL